MLLNKFGLEFRSLSTEMLDMVRIWRNADHVRMQMHYQDFISVHQQMEWFKFLDVSTNLYFVFIENEIPIGLANLKNIEWESRTAEAGIFIGDINYLNSFIPVTAAICLLDFAFDILQLKLIKAKIKADNQKAISFNLQLGYSYLEESPNSRFDYYTLTPDSFYSSTHVIRNTLNKMYSNNFEIEMTVEEKRSLKLI